MLINKKGERVVEPGEFRVMIGASYNNIKLRESFFVNDGSNVSLPIKSNKGEAKMMDDSNGFPNNSY
jgi:beta-glucosidase